MTQQFVTPVEAVTDQGHPIKVHFANGRTVTIDDFVGGEVRATSKSLLYLKKGEEVVAASIKNGDRFEVLPLEAVT